MLIILFQDAVCQDNWIMSDIFIKRGLYVFRQGKKIHSAFFFLYITVGKAQV